MLDFDKITALLDMMGFEKKGKLRMSSYGITGLVGLSYFGLYTAYDKGSKKLTMQPIKDFVTGARGWTWTLVEANKALSLTGLTCMMMSFLPAFADQSQEMLFQSMSILWAHSIYSFYKFYGNSLTNIIKDLPIKQISISMGVLGQLVLSLGYWGQISETALLSCATLLGVGHFYTYEIDYKWVLQVRPYAYLPFPLALGVFILNAGKVRNWIGALL